MALLLKCWRKKKVQSKSLEGRPVCTIEKTVEDCTLFASESFRLQWRLQLLQNMFLVLALQMTKLAWKVISKYSPHQDPIATACTITSNIILLQKFMKDFLIHNWVLFRFDSLTREYLSSESAYWDFTSLFICLWWFYCCYLNHIYSAAPIDVAAALSTFFLTTA